MSTELVKTGTTAIVPKDDRPAFMVDRAAVGLEGMAEKIRPSMLKLVQKQSSDELINLFGSYSIILTPDQELVCKAEEVASFVPLFYYVEYCKWAPLALKGVENMIVERTFDSKNPIALKAQNPATWSEDHPNYPGQEKYQYKYREHLNFIVKLLDEEHAHREPVLLSFSKTNYTVGQRLLKLIMQKRASVFAGRYQLGSRLREGAENKWRVFTVDLDQEKSWVDDDVMYQAYSDAYDYYKQLQASRQLDTNYEDEEQVEEASVSTDEIPY